MIQGPDLPTGANSKRPSSEVQFQLRQPKKRMLQGRFLLVSLIRDLAQIYNDPQYRRLGCVVGQEMFGMKKLYMMVVGLTAAGGSPLFTCALWL